MPQPNDLSRSLVALDHNSTVIAVIEISRSSWLVGGMVPSIEHQPRKSWLRRKRRWRSPTITKADTLTVMAEPECASLTKLAAEKIKAVSHQSDRFYHVM